MSCIIFRCDASLLIGTGHVIRCRTLARALKQRGVEVVFLCRPQPGDLISLLQQEFRVLQLPEQSLQSCVDLDDRELYGAWLGCSQLQDADDCLKALALTSVANPDWIVVDHYGLDVIWQIRFLKGLSSSSLPKILVIDDLADRPHQADILLDQNYYGDLTSIRYQHLVSDNCIQLLGPKYALLAPEYSQLHPLVPVRSELCRVLVFFGGVDRLNFTGRSLEALMDPAMANLAVDVVLGLQCPHRLSVAEQVAQRPNTTLHGPLPSLAGLLVRADLAIGAGGTTTWERACLKLPGLITPIAANQLMGVRALEQNQCIVMMSDTDSVDSIRSAILRFIDDCDLLPALSHQSSTLLDGQGASILCEQILSRNG